MEKEQQQKPAAGLQPTASHQTDPPPRDAQEEFPAAESVPSEMSAQTPQSEDAGEGLDNHQGVASVSTPSQALRRPKNKGKYPSDYTESDILPMMRARRKQGIKTKGTAIHKYLVRKYGPVFDCDVRTTQRLVTDLNAKLDLEESQRAENAADEVSPEISFRQEYGPGEVAQLDCSSLKSLRITINDQPYTGKLFTFKMMHSQWIYAKFVSGETEIEVLDAIQDALWALNGVPRELHSDNGAALFTKAHGPNDGYADLQLHYGTFATSTDPGKPNQNGGAETGNKTIKGLLQDRLTTDVDPKFESVEQLGALLKEELDEYNAKVQPGLKRERPHLMRLPKGRVEPYELIHRVVNKEGCIRIDGRLYSAPADLHGTQVKVHKYGGRLVIYDRDGKPAWQWPLATDAEARVDPRHVIRWLRRKPGAFRRYQFKEHMFPTNNFRETHQQFLEWYEPKQADMDYLSILQLTTGPHPIRQTPADDRLIDEVDCALTLLLEKGERFNFSHASSLIQTEMESESTKETSAVRQQTLDIPTLSRR